VATPKSYQPIKIFEKKILETLCVRHHAMAVFSINHSNKKENYNLHDFLIFLIFSTISDFFFKK